MGQLVIVLWMFFFLLLPRVEVFAQGSLSKTGRVGCPNCANDGSSISRSLQKGDELYAAFKPKEALAEFLKVLDSDPQNAEALSKIARVYIAFGDVIPESTPDWEAKRLKQYQIAEQYARKAVKADPSVVWGHFYVAASLGSMATVSPWRERFAAPLRKPSPSIPKTALPTMSMAYGTAKWRRSVR
jgi:tetratricopeptide (TPR) repeat protein